MVSFDTGLRFERLEQRLLEVLRQKVTNGELTERGLARRIGVSQPHIHNVLKGLRTLSAPVADLILEELGMNVLDLAKSEEMAAAMKTRIPDESELIHIGIACGYISPLQPFPDLGGVEDWITLPASAVRDVRRPLLVGVEIDRSISHCFPDAEFTLLDLEESQRIRPQPGSWYAVRLDGIGLVRQIRREGKRLHLLGQESFFEENFPQFVELEEESVLQFIRARVRWVGRDPRRPYSDNRPAAAL
jgi:plasmid maintenance system antidote protein VapI